MMSPIIKRSCYPEKHGMIAERLFKEGYNCAQAVLLAFCDETGLDEKTAAMLASSARRRNGQTARCMRDGQRRGDGAGDAEGLCGSRGSRSEKGALSAGAGICRTLQRAERLYHLSGSCLKEPSLVSEGGDPEVRTKDYYEKRPCPMLARCAAQILDEMLEQ